MLKQTILILIAVIGSATLSVAQTPTSNQAAVDMLTKEVATVVLANQRGDKAAEIVNELSMCGEGCDAVSVIKRVGGWDAVGVKMEELGRLKNTARFQAMSPGDANAAIRREFAQFYAKYKTDKNYGVPLSDEVQAQMLAKIDQIVPPNSVSPPVPLAAAQAADEQPEETTVSTENENIDSDAIRISQLERAVKEERARWVWLLILSGIAGLIVGAGVVYFMLYRPLRSEVNRLADTNAALSRELDIARRPKVANQIRPPSDTRTQQQSQSDPVKPNSIKADPVDESVDQKSSVTRSGTLVPGTLNPNEPPVGPTITPAPDQFQTQPIAPVPTPSPARSSVFYFPPPDPNGQFDNAQRADMLLPESAYRFSTNADSPDVATFRFEAEPGRVARFLTYRNYMIEPACDSENSFSSTYTRIVNKRDGESVFENGVWRVKTKALIRYE